MGSVGFIGAGNMAGAIIEGILKNQVYSASELTVCDVSAEKCRKYADMGMNVADSIRELARNSRVIFLAVKPQDYEKVLTELKGFADGGKIIISIAAGISTEYVRKIVGYGCKVVRAMPNTPLLLAEGATALCRGEGVSEPEFAEVRRIFEAGGLVCVLEEEQMNAVISVNSTSPVYVYLMAKAVVDGGAQQGIDEETSKALFCKTLIGTARMMMETGRSPDELVRMVASPGGTTEAALKGLEEHGFEDAVKDAMLRCTKRAEELGK